MFDIPYIKLHFYTELMADTVMPETKVAALRGGMGEMLLRQNCIADKNCHKCHFHKSCIVQHTFYSVMEKKPAYVTGDESVGYLIECMDRRTKIPSKSCATRSMPKAESTDICLKWISTMTSRIPRKR